MSASALPVVLGKRGNAKNSKEAKPDYKMFMTSLTHVSETELAKDQLNEFGHRFFADPTPRRQWPFTGWPANGGRP